MVSDYQIKDEVLAKLPLPLALLLRRASNAKTPLERHHAAYYLWEATLKLLGSISIVHYVEGELQQDDINKCLQTLARPSIGHWWEYSRRLLPILAKDSEDFVQINSKLLGKARDDLPRVAGLDKILREFLHGTADARSSVKLRDLFDRLIQYRNKELGHGAAGQRSTEYYEKSGRAFLAGVAELLEKIDFLAGHQLIYIGEVKKLQSGSWSVERYELIGENAKRIVSLEIPADQIDILPSPNSVHIQTNNSQDFKTSNLSPLLYYDFDSSEFFFLNSRRGKRRAEYLCYNTGQIIQRDNLVNEQRKLLADLLKIEVDEESLNQWVDKTIHHQSDEFEIDQSSKELGDFELLTEIGRGGMGVVYRAWQRTLGREVALKCLLRTGDSKSEARFAREIRSLAQVQHTNLVNIYSSGSDGDQWFYAMELIEGAELGQLCEFLQKGPKKDLSIEQWKIAVSKVQQKARDAEESINTDVENRVYSKLIEEKPSQLDVEPIQNISGYISHVVELIKQVADSAHALHQKGIIHRDIKPSNIMVTADGDRAILMDLGLAQLADETEGKLTRTRQFVGTLLYASPEQLLAVPNLDPRADVYSIGASLWELLTLQTLYNATDQTPIPNLMLMIQAQEPQRPKELNSNIPTDLESIVLKCLAKSRVDRYESAKELSDDLNRWLQGEPVVAKGVTTKYLARLWWKTHFALEGIKPVVWAAIIGLMWGLITTVPAIYDTISMLFDQSADVYEKYPSLTPPFFARRTTYFENTILPALSPLSYICFFILGPVIIKIAKPKKFGGDLITGSIAGFLGAISTLFFLTWAMILSLSTIPSLNDMNLLGKLGPVTKELHDRSITVEDPYQAFWSQGHRQPIDVLAVNQSGDLLASGSRDTTIKIWDIKNIKLIHTLYGHTSTELLDYYPNSSRFSEIPVVFSLQFFDDDTKLLSCGTDNTIRIWDTISGDEIHATVVEGVQSVAINEDYTKVIAVGSFDGIKIFDPQSLSLVEPLTPDNEIFRSDLSIISFLNGNVTLINSSNQIATFNLNDIKQEKIENAQVILGLDNFASGLIKKDNEGDGSVITLSTYKETSKKFQSTDELNSLLDNSKHGLVDSEGTYFLNEKGVWLLTEKPELLFELSSKSFTSARFSNNNQLVVSSGSGKIEIWDLKEMTRQIKFLPFMEAKPNLDVDPSGDFVATSGKDLKIWDIKNNILHQFCIGHIGTINTVEFHPEENILASCGSDKTIRIWPFEPKTSREDADESFTSPLSILRGHSAQVLDLAFSHSGELFASVDVAGELIIWDYKTESIFKKIQTTHSPFVDRVMFSPNDKLILTSSTGDSACLFDAISGDLLSKIDNESKSLHSSQFTKDSKQVVTSDEFGYLSWWDPITGELIERKRVTQESIYDFILSKTENEVITANEDGTIRLWNLVANCETDVLKYRGQILDVAAISNSEIVSINSEGILTVWNLGSKIRSSVIYTDFIPEIYGYKDLVQQPFRDRSSLLWTKILADQVTGSAIGIVVGIFMSFGLIISVALVQTIVAGALQRRRYSKIEYSIRYAASIFLLLPLGAGFIAIINYELLTAPSDAHLQNLMLSISKLALIVSYPCLLFSLQIVNRWKATTFFKLASIWFVLIIVYVIILEPYSLIFITPASLIIYHNRFYLSKTLLIIWTKINQFRTVFYKKR